MEVQPGYSWLPERIRFCRRRRPPIRASVFVRRPSLLEMTALFIYYFRIYLRVPYFTKITVFYTEHIVYVRSISCTLGF